MEAHVGRILSYKKPEPAGNGAKEVWHHDVLRTLDYFQASGATCDERLEDPVSVVLKRRTAEGRWVLQNRHVGRTFFDFETTGKPSRWNTLRALRVLQWYEKAKAAV